MKNIYLAITLFFSTSFASASKQNNELDSLKHKHIKELTVFGINAKTFALPFVVVTKDEIQKNEPRSVAEALAAETGLWLTRDGIWATSVNVRGMSEQRLLFMMDNDRILTSPDIAASLSTVDMSSVERLEVIKGASSVLYGTGAMGGVVNIISKRPTYSEHTKVNGNISSALHSVNNLFSNAANVSVSNKDWYLSLHGSLRNADNTMTPAGVLPMSFFSDKSWGAKAGIKYNENQELLLNYSHFQARNAGLPGGTAFTPTAEVRYLGVDRIQVSAEYKIKNISRTLKELNFKGFNQSITRDVQNMALPSKNEVYPSSNNQTAGGKAQAALYFNDYNTVNVGVEAWSRNVKTKRTRYIISATNDTIIIIDQPTPMASMTNVGAFAQYRKVIDPKYWSMNFGLRADLINMKNDTVFRELEKYRVLNGERKELPANKEVFFIAGNKNEISYSAHVDITYNPTRRQEFTLSLANAYRTATVEERFKYIDQQGKIFKGNPNLKAENGFFSNLSYAITNNKLSFKVDVFANYLFDLIAEKQLQNQPNVYEAINIDNAFFHGAETEFVWLISTKFWTKANLSYVNGRDVTTDNYLRQIPPLHGFVSINYRENKRFEAALSAQYAANKYNVGSGEAATDGYVVFNFNIQSAPIKLSSLYLQLFAGIDNILDTNYRNHMNYTRNAINVEPGRNFFAKANVKF
jgi:hemoglobin/transferrin/lactoferrin receptor protein